MPEIVGKLYEVSIFPYIWMFIMAAFVAEYKNNILPILKDYWWVFLALVLIRRIWLHWDIQAVYLLFDTILLFCGLLGLSYRLPQINIKTDISYGVYIYHMTIVNALIALGYTGQNWILWFVMAITCLFAWISTVTLGRFSTMKKKSL